VIDLHPEMLQKRHINKLIAGLIAEDLMNSMLSGVPLLIHQSIILWMPDFFVPVILQISF